MDENPDLMVFRPQDDITIAELAEIVALLTITIQGHSFKTEILSEPAKRHFQPHNFERIVKLQ